MLFNVLVLQGAFASSVAITLDMLNSAAQIAQSMRLPGPRWKVYGMTECAMLSSGLMLPTTILKHLPRSNPTQKIEYWVIPGLGLADPQSVQNRLSQPDAQAAIELLKKLHARGAYLYASCSATLLLAQAGLLAGRKATTTWWLASQLQRIEPRCALDVNRMLIRDGTITTAGAALSQSDLMQHLVKETLGIRLANALSRVLLLDQRQSQVPYIVPSAYTSGDELVTRLCQRLQTALSDPPSMRVLADEFHISPRSLARYVKAATGRTPLALLQSIRIHQAQHLLKTSRLSVEEIATHVGYSDATALRRLLKSSMQMTPQQLRGKCL